jgi:hypothetical protein
LDSLIGKKGGHKSKKIQSVMEAFFDTYAIIRHGVETKFTNIILVVPSVTHQEGSTECGLVVIRWMFALLRDRKLPYLKIDFGTSLGLRVSNKMEFNFDTADMAVLRRKMKFLFQI